MSGFFLFLCFFGTKVFKKRILQIPRRLYVGGCFWIAAFVPIVFWHWQCSQAKAIILSSSWDIRIISFELFLRNNRQNVVRFNLWFSSTSCFVCLHSIIFSKKKNNNPKKIRHRNLQFLLGFAVCILHNILGTVILISVKRSLHELLQTAHDPESCISRFHKQIT